MRVAMEISPKRRMFRNLPEKALIVEAAVACTGCFSGMRACPNNRESTAAITSASKGDLAPLAAIYDSCIGCARCEDACPSGLSPHDLISRIQPRPLPPRKIPYQGRAGSHPGHRDPCGRGTHRHGGYPRVVATVGCSNYPGSWNDVGSMAEEFLKRRYIVVTSG